jgi:hypothetical protein
MEKVQKPSSSVIHHRQNPSDSVHLYIYIYMWCSYLVRKKWSLTPVDLPNAYSLRKPTLVLDEDLLCRTICRRSEIISFISLRLSRYVDVEVTLRLTVSESVCLGVGHPFGAHDQILLFPFFCGKIALLFVLGRPLWREDGFGISSAICQWSESRRTENHALPSHLRLLGPLSVASYNSQGLRWKYSYPPPHGDSRYVSSTEKWR